MIGAAARSARNGIERSSRPMCTAPPISSSLQGTPSQRRCTMPLLGLEPFGLLANLAKAAAVALERPSHPLITVRPLEREPFALLGTSLAIGGRQLFAAAELPAARLRKRTADHLISNLSLLQCLISASPYSFSKKTSAHFTARGHHSLSQGGFARGKHIQAREPVVPNAIAGQIAVVLPANLKHSCDEGSQWMWTRTHQNEVVKSGPTEDRKHLR